MTEEETRNLAELLSNDPQFSALISVQVSDHIDKRVKDREDRLLKILGVITAVIVFLGYSGIKELINSAALSSVNIAFQHRTSELEMPVYLATLATYVAKADNSGKFSNTEREDMIATLEKLSDLRRKGVSIGDGSFFSATLESVVKIMAASDNNYFVDRIFDLYSDDCLKVSSIVQTLLPHYGRQMVVGVGDIQVEAKRRFQLAERAASTHKIDEFSLVHRILYEFKAAGNKKSADTDNAIKLLAPRDDDDKSMAWQFLNDYANESWVKRPIGESKVLGDIARKFLQVYGPELDAIGFKRLPD